MITTDEKVPNDEESERSVPSQSQDFGDLYNEIRTSLMHFAARYFRRPQEIEDVVQQAFVRVIEAQHKRSIRSPKAYLYRTTRNLALNQIDKSAYKLTECISDIATDVDLLHTLSLEEQFESRERFELFCRAVRELPLKCQRVFILRRVYGFTQKEVAERIGISLKTVEAHLTKAIVRCTDYMEAEMEREATASTRQSSGGKHHG